MHDQDRPRILSDRKILPRIWVKSFVFYGLFLAVSVAGRHLPAQELGPREDFELGGQKAFVWLPPIASRMDGKMPWVWYAPTLANRYPGKEEHWMINLFHRNGIAIAGIDVGESYGSPLGTHSYQGFYEHLTQQRGFSSRPVLLARSRGGLMLYNWAVEHPESVAAVAGIYPVCDLRSYPGLAKAAGAYERTTAELESDLHKLNPVQRIDSLAAAGVPILHIHGDQDRVVPNDQNSAALAKNYRAAGGKMYLHVCPGQGHNMWDGWFRSPLITEFLITHAVGRNADATTLRKTVMVGYQGWFNCEGDGAGLGWKHWARGRKGTLGPGNVTVDLWPDMSEYGPKQCYASEFRLADGTAAEVFSSADGETVGIHFRWMRDYGIDGAFLQRFANGFSNEALMANKDRVLQNVRESALRFGRNYAVMYDLSGVREGEVKRVFDDWQKLSATVVEDPNYLHLDGRPLVAVWGVGFADNRAYSLEECADLISRLKSSGCAIMLGVPTYWRTGERDAVADPELQDLLKQADVISPWSVGRYRTEEQAQRHAEKTLRADQTWCNESQIDFLPVVFPGFSWRNLKGSDTRSIPRNRGEFLKTQISAAKQVGCEMLYVAMFDEVDEGTAIFKCTNNPPVGPGANFADYEGLPSDYYLKLTGRAAKLLRGELSLENWGD